jgi:hypothetical protein
MCSVGRSLFVNPCRALVARAHRGAHSHQLKLRPKSDFAHATAVANRLYRNALSLPSAAAKPPAPPRQTIKVVVRNALGADIIFKIRKVQQLSRVFEAYVKKVHGDGVNVEQKLLQMRFQFDQERLSGLETPEGLDPDGVEEKLVIDYMEERWGGGSCPDATANLRRTC